MNGYLRYRYLLFLFVLVVGCGDSQKFPYAVKVEIQEGADSPDSVYFSGRDIVFLDSPPEALLGSVDKIVLTDNRIIILDRLTRSVVLFDKAGRFVTTLASRGRGEGEYVGLTDFTWNDKRKEIILFADVPTKFMFFDSNGRFKYELSADEYYYEIACVDDHLVCQHVLGQDREHYLREFTYDTLALKSTKDYDFPHESICDVFPNGKSLVMSEYLYFTKRYDNTIYRLKRGRIEPYLDLDFEDHNFPGHLQGKKLTEQQFMEERTKLDFIYAIIDVKHTSRYLFGGTNKLGIFVWDRQDSLARYWHYVTDHELHLKYTRMTALEDPTHQKICFVRPVMGLKSELAYSEARQAPEWFKEKIDCAEDTDNPVLFIYEAKK